MQGWTPAAMLPGALVAVVWCGVAFVLRRWFDAVPLRIWAVIALLVGIVLAPVLVGGQVLLPLDNLRLYVPFTQLPPPPAPSFGLQSDQVHELLPWLAQVRRSLVAGRWPLWNDLAGAGMPLLADPQSQAMQPLAWVTLAAPLAAAPAVLAALRLLAAFTFTFLLLRRQGLGEPAALLGSIVFGLGGGMMLWMGWPIATSLALLPLSLYAVVRCHQVGGRRDHLLLALATAGLLLAGHPETVVYGAALSATWVLACALARRPIGRDVWRFSSRAAMAMGLGALLATPALLPTHSFLPVTLRGVLMSEALKNGTPPSMLSPLYDREQRALWWRRTEGRLSPVVAPGAFGNRHGYWNYDSTIENSSAFMGTVALAVALVAALPGARRRPGERLMLGTIGLTLALVAQPPGFDFLFARLPVLGPTALHQHHRLLLIAGLALAYVAACELDRWLRGAGRRRALVAVTVVKAVLVPTIYASHVRPGFETLTIIEWRALSWQLAALVVGAVLLLAIGARAGQVPAMRRNNLLAWGLLVCVATELLVVHLPTVAPAPARLFYPLTPPLRFLAGEGGALVGVGTTLPANFGQVLGLRDARVTGPSVPAVYAQLLSQPPKGLNPYEVVRPLYDLLGVRWVLGRPQAQVALPVAFRDPAGWVFARPRALPRLFLPLRSRLLDGERWQQDVRSVADFAAESLVLRGDLQHERRPRWAARRPRRSRLELRPRREPELLLADAALVERRLLASSVLGDPGWRLLVDREPWKTTAVNGPFVGAWLPKGRYPLALVYRPTPFLVGCLLAGLAAALGVCTVLPPPRRAWRLVAPAAVHPETPR